MRRLSLVVAVVVGAGLIAGCTDKSDTAPPAAGSNGATAPGSAPAAAPSPADRLCADPELNDKQVAFEGPAGFLTAYLLGTGPTTLVLAPQASATGCSWLSWARREAQLGYSVLAFDFHGEGRSRPSGSGKNSGDVTAAATFARTRGAKAVVLIGASRGGTATLVAAAALTPPPAAVVSLSAPAVYSGEDALAAVPKLAAPTLYVSAKDDAPFAADAQTLHDATPADRRTLAIVPGQTHGTALFTITGDGTAEAMQAVDDFLAARAKP